MSTRYFEFVREEASSGGTASGKFWEIAVNGSDLTVRFGKLGVTGQTTTKSFDSAAEASKEAAKLIASKVKKGYVEKA